MTARIGQFEHLDDLRDLMNFSRFFASYRGICSAKRYKTVVVFWRFIGQKDLDSLKATSLPTILCLLYKKKKDYVKVF